MRPAIFGALVAIGITTTMDATGLTMFSALPLFPLAGAFWWWQRFSRAEVGLAWGSAQGYGVALLYPIVVLGTMAGVAAIAGDLDPSGADWKKTGINIAMMSTVGILMGMLTEEGFFRGWLWAALRRAGKSEADVLVWSSVVFALWHVSAISLDTGFDVPPRQIPIYVVNATLIGAIWGMIRWLSGSIVASSVSHAVWNGLDYPLFGFGTHVGALGITRTDLFGPEVGAVGLGLNLVFAAGLWVWMGRRCEGARSRSGPID